MLALCSSVGAEPVTTSAVTFDASCSKNAGGLIENEGNAVLRCSASMVPSQEVSLLILFYKIISYRVLFHKDPVNLYQHGLANSYHFKRWRPRNQQWWTPSKLIWRKNPG